MKRLKTKILTVLIAVTLLFTSTSFQTLVAAAKTTKKVNVTNVTITKPTNKTLVLVKGKTYTLKTSVTPSNATNKKLEFTSSNQEVVSVSTKGKLKAIKNGSATISVKTTDGSKKVATLTVSVGVPVTKVKLNKTVITVEAESQAQLKVTVSPSKATVKTVKWTSSDSEIATVDSNGIVTANAEGRAKIIAIATDGSNKKDSCIIVVTEIKPTAITLSLASQTLKEKETFSLEAQIMPLNTKDKSVTWSSDNEAVATVDSNGKVEAIAEGKASITVTANGNDSVKATCQVTVTKAPIVIIGGGSTTGGSNTGGSTVEEPTAEVPTDEYDLVWSDDFTGTSLDMSMWNMEIHDPGWVNSELQAYTSSPDNIYVENGNLVIRALETVSGEAVSYSSGKVTTQNKEQFKYGKFEIKAKIPSGQGLWPAIWMMSDENLYGQWPKCGEIDIMEILGHEPNKLYSTVHYGAPHTEKQGTYLLENGTFADDYHVYSVEWEPSEMRFYIDGNLYHTVNDWFTKVEGQGEITYPAPFDQPFFLQLNLAVGGSWPGNPDDTTDFENAKLLVDYVKVFQLKSYDENVTKPVADVTLRDPDANGNYMINGNFDIAEDLADNKDWTLLTAGGGAATASIAQNLVSIDSTNFGTVSYAIQLVQPKLPMKKGGNYRLTYDAKASADRKIVVAVTAPEKNWIRYMQDTEVTLTTSLQSYSHDFSVTTESDINGRLEFNLGLLSSLANVEISNVKLVKFSETEIVEDHTKTILPDGNYIYNGAFQEGATRMEYWTVDNKVQGAVVAVTNIDNIRELKVEVPNTVLSISDVIVKQTELAISANKDYTLSFDAYGSEEKTIQTKIDGQTFDTAITATAQTFTYQFTTGNTVTSADLEFLLGIAGTTYIDNVKIVEAGMLINGDFASGFSGWEVYIDNTVSTKVTYAVDGLTENSAAAFTIDDSGDQAYKIQLKQNNVILEQGKWYRLTLDAKSDFSRKLMIALQRDGSVDNDWTPYGETVVDLGSNYENYEIIFQMLNNTDTKTILSISMGAVAGIQITDAHKICIDNVMLEETTEPVTPPAPGVNLISNGDFSQGQTNWIAAVSSPGAAEYSFADNKAVFNITNIGTIDWHIQLKQSGLVFEKDKVYQVKMKMTSSVARTVRLAYMSTSYAWYGGADVALLAGEAKEVDLTFTMNATTDQAADFVLSMGYLQDLAVNPGVITIENVSITEVVN